MTTKIYDYEGKITNITIPDDKEISAIFVVLLSGDETGTILFTDGTTMQFDASEWRIQSFFDGSYVVTAENIQKWLNWNADTLDTNTTERRAYAFDGKERWW